MCAAAIFQWSHIKTSINASMSIFMRQVNSCIQICFVLVFFYASEFWGAGVNAHSRLQAQNPSTNRVAWQGHRLLYFVSGHRTMDAPNI